MAFMIRLAPVLLCLFVAACRVELSTTAGGRITTASGNFTCTPNSSCPVIDVVDTGFDETFTAVPDSGFVFDGWRRRQRGFCGGSTDDCRLFTSGFAGNSNLLGILNSDQTFFLEAVFRESNVTGTAFSLTSSDRPSTAPCPDRSVLSNPAALATLKDAILTGALAFRDVPFSSADPDNFKRKCGFNEFWDPAANVDDITPMSLGITSITISQLFSNGNAGICTAGSSPANFLSGFPQAGVYRTEFRAAKGANNYLVRLRSTVSGSAAGNEFLTESVMTADIENNLEYRVNGSVASHANVLNAVVNAVSVDGDAVQLDVLRSRGGEVILSVSIEMICVSRS
ncbi:MAG: hypothetical protein AAF671_09935 [Pseudomonadota bacterium]